MDPQCLLTEKAAKGLVMDQSRQITRGNAGPDDRDSWPRSERWPILADAGGDVPGYPWEHTLPAPLSHEPSERRQPLNALVARVQQGLRLARIM